MFKAGDQVKVSRPKSRWDRDGTIEGKIEQVTDHLYVVMTVKGWRECFMFNDPDVRIRKC